MKHAVSISLFALSLSLIGTSFADAQLQTVHVQSAGSLAASQSISSRFAPKPSVETRLNYEAWDRLLKDFVLYGGPSLRKRASRPDPVVGTRFVHGHTSPYRMEGNRIVFEELNEEYRTAIKSYAADLIEIGNRIDISALPRNEQLAYWFNLHNALVIDGIADVYPTARPDREKGPDGRLFHDSIRATIDGVPLSLRAIREDIVYSNWKDPIVIYGFFLGDIGSPTIQRAAFTGPDVRNVLKLSASEFVNSLRGFEQSGNTARISEIYQVAAPYFFSDFNSDVRAHMASYMDKDIRQAFLSSDVQVEFSDYAYDTADLTAGDGNRQPFSQIQSRSRNGLPQSTFRSGPMSRQLREFRQKFETIRLNGLSGTVIIEDIETEDSENEQID